MVIDDGFVCLDGVGLCVWCYDLVDFDLILGNEVEILLVDLLDCVWVGINGVGLSMLGLECCCFECFVDVNVCCEG